MPQASASALLDTAARALDLARAAGATSGDVYASSVTEFEVKVSGGEIVTLTQGLARGLGLRVFVGGRLGFCTTQDFSRDALKRLAARAVAIARETAEDPHNGIAALAARGHTPALDLFDPAVVELSIEEKISWAHALEHAARAASPHVTRFRHSGVMTAIEEHALVTSDGVALRYESTSVDTWCNPIAERDGELQTEVWYDTKTHLEDLEPREVVGRTAALRAARMLGAHPVKTQRVPVIFEPLAASSLLGGLVAALDGDMVYKRSSCLVDRLGEQIAAQKLTLTDDPLLARGVGSAPFDGEGMSVHKKDIVDRGRLTTYLYDSYAARKAGATPTASARRGYASLPRAGVFNFYAAAGEHDPAAIIRDSERALIVTRGLGSGINPVTGEYSLGVNGLWVEHGEIAHPVAEVTIAGDYLEMLAGVDRVGRDLLRRGAVGAPTLRINEMMVSGL